MALLGAHLMAIDLQPPVLRSSQAFICTVQLTSLLKGVLIQRVYFSLFVDKKFLRL